MGYEYTAGTYGSAMNENFTVFTGPSLYFLNECVTIYCKGCDVHVFLPRSRGNTTRL